MTQETITVQPALIKASGKPVIILTAPYHPDLPARARAIGGQWSDAQKHWQFDPRDEARVLDLARDIYGTDGRTPSDTVTIRVTYNASRSAERAAIYFAGREIAHASGRDSGARLGQGVILLAGKANSGGSAKNWSTTINAGTILEIRDLPREMVERELLAADRTIVQSCYHAPGTECSDCETCHGARSYALHPLSIEIMEDAETPEQVAARIGQGEAASPVAAVWGAIQALAIEDQIEIRNRLMAAS